MKLLIIAAVIAVCSGGRLDHLDRSYLPPEGSGTVGSNGLGSGGNAGNQNSGFSGAASRQYLAPNQATTGSTSNGLSSEGSAINSACSSGGSSSSPGHHGQSSQPSVRTNSYGIPQRGAASGSPNGYESSPDSSSRSAFSTYRSPSGSSFGSPGATQESDSYGSQRATSRQYSTPAVSTQNSHERPFEQKSGSSFGSTDGLGSASGSSIGSSIRSSGAPSGSTFGSLSGARGLGNYESQGATSRQYLAPGSSSQNDRQQLFDPKSGSASLDLKRFGSGSSSSSGSTLSNFGSPSGFSFGSPSGSHESGNYGSQGATSRQQPFEQKSGASFSSINGFRSASGSPVSDGNSGAPSGYSYGSPSGPQRFDNYESQGAPASSQSDPQQPFDEKSGYVY